MHKALISYRPAAIADARTLFEWRNDPVTRAMSRSQSEVAFSDHLEWLTNSLSNDTRRIVVALSQGGSVGVIRLDRSGKGQEASWTVAPTMRGNGVCSRMLIGFLPTVAGQITAEIKPENIASILAAKAAGFSFTGQSKDGLQQWNRP